MKNYDHNEVLHEMVSKRVSRRAAEYDTIKGLEKACPNIQRDMTADMLIIMDSHDARRYLGLSSEQQAELSNLFAKYSDAVRSLQDILADSLSKSPSESYRFHLKMASDFDKRFTKDFKAILLSSQHVKLDQLRLQVIGYSSCFTSPTKELLCITKEQEKFVLRHTSKRIHDFPEKMVDSELDYEKLFRFETFMSNVIYNEVLNDDQRKLLSKFISDPIEPEVLRIIRKEYLKRTALWVKNGSVKN